MQAMDDQSLLDRFAKSHDADAFEELTRRYWGLVYSSAQRQVRDVHLAEDVTQAVFIVLANRAGSIRRGVVLSSWLFTVTRHAVCNAKRMLARQRYHESRKAAMSSEQNLPLNQTDDRLLPLVDEAVLRLSEGERSAVLLRYF